MKKSTLVYLEQVQLSPADWKNEDLRNEKAAELRGKMLNMVNHYQDDHTNCNPDSECAEPRYMPSRDIIPTKVAKKLTETLKKSKIYQFAEGMVLGITTSDDESINNVLGAFIEKRVNFSSPVYNMRVGIVVLYWNANTVNRGTRKVDYNWMDDVKTGYFESIFSL